MSTQTGGKFAHSEGNGKLGKTKMACGFTVTVSDEFKQFLCEYLKEDSDYLDFMTTIHVGVFFCSGGPAQHKSWLSGGGPRLPQHCKRTTDVYQWWLKKDRIYRKDGPFKLPLQKLYVSKKKDLVVGVFDCENKTIQRQVFFLNQESKSTTFIKQQLERGHLKELGMEEVELPEKFVMDAVPYSV